MRVGHEALPSCCWAGVAQLLGSTSAQHKSDNERALLNSFRWSSIVSYVGYFERHPDYADWSSRCMPNLQPPSQSHGQKYHWAYWIVILVDDIFYSWLAGHGDDDNIGNICSGVEINPWLLFFSPGSQRAALIIRLKCI